MVTAAQHGNAHGPLVFHSNLIVVAATWVLILLSGPVAFVLATLFEDFKKKFNAWVESV
jgi:hypothetical protein